MPVVHGFFQNSRYIKSIGTLLSGKIIDANEAKEIGLVSYIFEDDEMLEKSLDYCKILPRNLLLFQLQWHGDYLDFAWR